MYNGLPARMEHDIKSLYLDRVLQVSMSSPLHHIAPAPFPALHVQASSLMMKAHVVSAVVHVCVQGNKEGMRKLKLKVHAPPRRKHMVFLGAAILADIMKDDTSGKFWVNKQDWQEDPHRALRKCDGLGGNR